MPNNLTFTNSGCNPKLIDSKTKQILTVTNNKMSQNCKGKNKHMPSLRLVQMLEKSDTCFKTTLNFINI